MARAEAKRRFPDIEWRDPIEPEGRDPRDEFNANPNHLGKPAGGAWSGEAEDFVVDTNPLPAYARWGPFSDDELELMASCLSVAAGEDVQDDPELELLRQQIQAERERRSRA